MTPIEMRQEADRLRRQADSLEREADEDRAEADDLDDAADAMDGCARCPACSRTAEADSLTECRFCHRPACSHCFVRAHAKCEDANWTALVLPQARIAAISETA